MAIKKEKNKKIYLIIIGILLLFSGLSLISYHVISNRQLDILEDDAIEDFYINDGVIDNNESTNEPQEKEEVKEQRKIEYIAILKIPKIDLERGLVDPNSYLNNVNYNIEICKNSTMPDKINGNLILAAHSGNARVSYFRNLDKLSINDTVTIVYKGITYNYKVVDIYDIEKNGTAQIIRNKNKNTITLITCIHKTNKQIVIICEIEK